MIHAVLGWIYAEKGDLKTAYKETLSAIEKIPSLGDDYTDIEESTVTSLMINLADAMRSNLLLAKQQADLFLFSITK